MTEAIETKEVQHLYDKLINKVKDHHKKIDIDAIKKAFFMSYDAHKHQKRKSGEPYIIHPLFVAIILCDLGMDTETLVAGLLHDIIEDTTYTYADIKSDFNEEIANLVMGVTKLLKIEYKKDGSKKQNTLAENYRRMFLATASDIRIIIIKMADRLHNMRTLEYMTEEKQRQKAQETLDIYAPLALRLGISTLRNELEDLSFRYLEPEAYRNLADKIRKKQTQRQKLIDEMIIELDEKIRNSSFIKTFPCEFKIEGRPKHFFSIHKKMKDKQLQLEQIYDLFAVRIMVTTDMECYGIFGVIHEHYKPMPGRIKDYIAHSKSNGYQSLHTTIIGLNGEPFEIQIRTKEMHEYAEYGIAAHWKYKERPNTKLDPNSEDAKFLGIRSILDLQREMPEDDDEEYLEALKTDLDIYTNSVYVYTPRGDVVELRDGATPVDFAYAIHSAVGNTMVGAKVNNIIVPFEHKLRTGDRVEVLTSRNSKGPKPEWLNFVKTSQAKNRIRASLKELSKTEHHAIGKELLEAEANKNKTTLVTLLTEARKQYILNKYNYIEWDSFLSAVGRRSIKEEQVIKRLILEKQREEDKLKKYEIKDISVNDSNINLSHIITPLQPRQKSKSGIVIQGLGDVDVRFSKCCTPIPGDDIIGFITRGRGVSVHRTDCKNIIYLPNDEKNRLLETMWDIEKTTNKSTKYTVEIRIIAEDKIGVVLDISNILNDFRINIKNLNVSGNGSIANILCGIAVDSKEQLDKLCNRILKIKEVIEVNR